MVDWLVLRNLLSNACVRILFPFRKAWNYLSGTYSTWILLSSIVSITTFFLLYSSTQPGLFSLSEIGYYGSPIKNVVSDIPAPVDNETKPEKAMENELASGELFVRVNRKMVDTMMGYKAGWLPNDKISPTMFLDNNINFQLGWREVLLRNILTLRESLSRQDRSTSPIDPNVDKAYGHFSVNPTSWIFPSYEGELKKGNKELGIYLGNLRDGKSGFYARDDTLVKLLEQYASLLGSTSNKLLVNSGIGFFNQDDRFYFAKGVLWGMYHTLLAVRVEFRGPLSKDNGDKVLDSIIKELKMGIFEPAIVLNGDIDGPFNSHLARLNVHLLMARQKMNSLASILLHRGSPSGG
ncbi:MAG: DUF2333 family protein [Methanobacteriota archaeon]|nr:MAG: DUF2333 family protein [Euryarchaeota archaeon]